MQLFARRLLLLVTLSWTTVGGPATAQPVVLEALAPSQDGGIPTQAASGWSLILRATAYADPLLGDPLLGIADASAGQFTIQGQTSYLVYADPEGCFAPPESNEPGSNESGNVSDCLASTRATYIEFTPDFDAPDLLDGTGNERVKLALTNPFSRPPKVGLGPDTGSALPEDPTIPVEAEVLDGYAYGADDDFPSLAIFADTGISIALDSGLKRLFPLRARNLAGFLTSVSYELDEGDGETAILASLFAAQRLFTPLVLVDNCISSTLDPPLDVGGDEPPGSGVRKRKRCTAERFLRQIDGGPLLSGPPVWDDLAKIVTVRAFLVSGTAPSVLEDLDHDLTVDVDDAQIAGYQVLSNEVVVRFEQLPCSGICQSAFAFDLDRNGKAFPDTGGIVFRARAGPKLTRILR